MRTLDGYLSRKAQTRVHRSALVYREEDGTYTLEREGVPPLSLGNTYTLAQQGVQALGQAQSSPPDVQ